MFLSSKAKTGIGIAAGAVLTTSMVAFLTLTSDQSVKCSKDYGLEYGDGVCINNGKELYDSIYFVYGKTQNTLVTNLDSFDKDTQKLIKASIMTEDNATIKAFSVTPHSKVFMSENYKNNKATISEQISISENATNKLKREADKYVPTEDGADYLSAILEAAGNVGDSKRSIIFITGSGLSDSGSILNFAQDDLLNHSIDEIMKKVSTAGIFENYSLEGIDIVWGNIGKVSDSHARLGNYEKKVENIYRAIFNKLGAKSVKFTNWSEKKNDTNYDGNGYNVKPTKIPTEQNYFEFGEESIPFVPGTTSFSNEMKAEETLKAIKERYNGNNKIIVTGYMSNGGCGFTASNNLDLRRAEAIKQKLISAGINGNSIEVKGGGIPDGRECTNGIYDQEIAKSNRKVVIEIF